MPTDAAAVTLGSSMTAEALPRVRRPSAPPDSARARGAWRDWVFEHATLVFALLVLGLLAGILVALGIAAAPALEKFGIGFFFTNVWNPVKGIFGGLAPIYGTLVTSAIALLIGVPVSFGIALFLTEMCPVILKRPLGTAIELLAAIPSIIYGIWGLFIFAPLFGDYVQPLLTQTLGRIPLVGALFQGAPERNRHLHRRVHPLGDDHSVHRLGDARRVRDRSAGAEGVGVRSRRDDVGSRLERRAALHEDRRDRRHHARARASARRDDGGHVRDRQRLPDQRRRLFDPGNSIASALANEFNEAADPVHRASLIALGLVLFVLTFVVLACSRLLIAQLARGEGRST